MQMSKVVMGSTFYTNLVKDIILNMPYDSPDMKTACPMCRG